MTKVWDKYKWTFFDYQSPRTPVREAWPISIVTTCMGRAYDLKKTLKSNLQSIEDYPDIEWLILNYNSQDDLDLWMKEEMMEWIEKGILNYYHTQEPDYYSMTQSRNLAFKLAAMHRSNNDEMRTVINQIDADNFIANQISDDEFGNYNFADMINFMVHQKPDKAIFCKSKRMNNGRLGMRKDEFLGLGGYDECIEGYGYDDHDLVNRFMLDPESMYMWYGGRFVNRIKTPRAEVGNNMRNSNWKETEDLNKDYSLLQLEKGIVEANAGTHWGQGTLIRNWQDTIRI
jgi:hypothetical protein